MPPALRAVRADLPCLAGETYLNAGGSGPLPRAAADALAAWAAEALARGRGGPAAIAALEASAEATRAAAGRVVGAPAGEIALTVNTTHGNDVVVWGLGWRPGDEIVTTALEHPGLSVPLAVAARRAGARLRIVPSEEAHGDLEAAVGARAGPRTRLVALSHVAYGTGAVLDVRGAARAAAAVGALTLVDGAQAVGALPVEAAALGVDAYAFPAHKWLLGPEGAGALWVSPRAAERLELSFAGYESGTGHRPDGTLTPHRGARRFEMSTPPAALLAAWRAALAWLDGLGWEWIQRRTLEAQAAARAALEAVPGVEVLTPPGPQAGLVTFRAPGPAPREASARLAAQGVVVRWLEHPAALRASAGFYTDAADVARLEAAVAGLDGC